MQSFFTTNQAEEDSRCGICGGLRNFLELPLHFFNKHFFKCMHQTTARP